MPALSVTSQFRCEGLTAVLGDGQEVRGPPRELDAPGGSAHLQRRRLLRRYGACRRAGVQGSGLIAELLAGRDGTAACDAADDLNQVCTNL